MSCRNSVSSCARSRWSAPPTGVDGIRGGRVRGGGGVPSRRRWPAGAADSPTPRARLPSAPPGRGPHHARAYPANWKRRRRVLGRGQTRPLAALGRIAEYYALALRSDRGYVGVLAYNPVHSDYATVYPRCEPYDLAELARALPAHWRRPTRPSDFATAPGRNCYLFAALCKLALGGSDEAPVRRHVSQARRTSG